MFKVVCALACAQVCGILHRDVKPSNILLDSKLNSSLTDWGLASIQIGVFTGLVDQSVQTIWYRCPEYLLDIKEYHNNYAMDMWSVGMITLEISMGKTGLARGSKKTETLHSILLRLGIPTGNDFLINEKINLMFDSGKLNKSLYSSSDNLIDSLTLKNNLPVFYASFVKSCLEWSPKKRLTPLAALKHPFFEDMYEELSDEIKELLAGESIVQKLEISRSFFPINKEQMLSKNPKYLKNIRQSYLSLFKKVCVGIQIYGCCVAYIDKLHEIIDFSEHDFDVNIPASIFFFVNGMAHDTPCSIKSLTKMFGQNVKEHIILDFVKLMLQIFSFPVVIKTICSFEELFDNLHDSLNYVFTERLI